MDHHLKRLLINILIFILFIVVISCVVYPKLIDNIKTLLADIMKFGTDLGENISNSLSGKGSIAGGCGCIEGGNEYYGGHSSDSSSDSSSEDDNDSNRGGFDEPSYSRLVHDDDDMPEGISDGFSKVMGGAMRAMTGGLFGGNSIPQIPFRGKHGKDTPLTMIRILGRKLENIKVGDLLKMKACEPNKTGEGAKDRIQEVKVVEIKKYNTLLEAIEAHKDDLKHSKKTAEQIYNLDYKEFYHDIITENAKTGRKNAWVFIRTELSK